MKDRKEKLMKHINYIDERKDEVLRLEERLRQIKKDPEWIRARSHLNVAKYKGYIDDIPSPTNGYKRPEILL